MWLYVRFTLGWRDVENMLNDDARIRRGANADSRTHQYLCGVHYDEPVRSPTIARAMKMRAWRTSAMAGCSHNPVIAIISNVIVV